MNSSTQVKSFIETQRALLAEIQNGCKRNFILAKEKEENEQKMRQSASMAEIATEDGTREEEEPAASQEDSKETDGKEKGDGPPAGSDEQQLSQPEASSEPSVAPAEVESDSDTEDEEEEVQAVSVSSAPPGQPACQTPPSAPPSVLDSSASSFCSTSLSPSSSTSPTAGPTAISGITVTESPVPPGTPPSPGRCISVSSPGRGHKIFMVTRVESPPEQQQQQQLSATTAPSRSSDKRTDANASHKALPSSQMQLTQNDLKGASSPPTDCKTSEHSSPTLMPQPAEPTSTLAPEEAEPNQPKRPPASPSLPLVMDEEEKNQPEDLKNNESRDSQQETDPAAAEEQEVKVTDESDPPAGGDTNGPEPTSDSPDKSSTEEAECPAKVPVEGAVATVLPNGLNSEFTLHLLDGDAPKASSCVMEHGECKPAATGRGINC